jgi:ABC-type transport system involved in multi-copper enzyme maturation permease subunit
MGSLAWISPFHYFPALGILAGDAVPWRDITTLLTATTAFCVIAYWRFNRRDL